MRTDTKTHIASNYRTLRNYEIIETIEAGLVVKGSEIKSIRQRHVDISRAYIYFNKGEAWLSNAHIATYAPAGIYGTHDVKRDRKLLMHSREINRMAGRASQQGLTVVPIEIYIRNHLAKIRIGLARGIRKHDIREVIKAREAKKEIRNALKIRR